MKSCLKCTTPPNTLAPPTPAEPASSMSAELPDHRPPLCNKHVSFCDRGSEQVFVADEWDRTPMDPARKLSYADVLELKQMHATLPRAEQAPETAAYHPRYLKAVPIHILPLLPASEGPRMTSARDMFKSVPSANKLSPSPPVGSPFARSPLGGSPLNGSPRSSSPHRFTSARDMFAKPGSHPPSPPKTPPPVQHPASAPARRRLNMAFLPLLPPVEPEPTSSPAPDRKPEPEPTPQPAQAAAADYASNAHPKASGDVDPKHAASEIEHNLPTPSSTPALTARSLDETDSSTSMPATPNSPGDGDSETVLGSADAAPHSLDAPPSPQTSPARKQRAPVNLQAHLDKFPVPPTAVPTGSSPPGAQSTFTNIPPAPSSPHSPPSPEALARRLASLTARPSPGSSTNSESSSAFTPSGNSGYTSSAMSSSGMSAHDGVGAGGSYFGLPLRGSRPALPTAGAASVLPPHLRKGAALPDSPFVDPMLAPRPASEKTAPIRPKPESVAESIRVASVPPLLPLALPPKALRGLRLEALPSPLLIPPSPLILEEAHGSHRSVHEPTLVPLPPPVPADGNL